MSVTCILVSQSCTRGSLSFSVRLADVVGPVVVENFKAIISFNKHRNVLHASS